MRIIELHTAPIDYDMTEGSWWTCAVERRQRGRSGWWWRMKIYSLRYFWHTRQRWFKAPAREGPSHTLTVRNIQAQLQVRPINGCKQEGRPRPLYILHKNAFLWGGKWLMLTFITKKPILHCNAWGRATPYLWCLTKRANQSPQCFIKTDSFVIKTSGPKVKLYRQPPVCYCGENLTVVVGNTLLLCASWGGWLKSYSATE